MNYKRVIPRDLFNEAKLLKCLGKISLCILDGDHPITERMVEPELGFVIYQDDSDGSIFVHNIHYVVRGLPVHFYTPMNSKEPWPLQCIYGDDEIIEVFDDRGDWTDEFDKFISGE